MDLTTLLQAYGPTVGYIIVTSIVFAESGLLVGFFLPGDSLLFTAGILASRNIFDIRLLCTLAFAAAVGGDSVGYYFGQKMGKRLFKKEDSLLFHKDNLRRAEEFFERHGKKTIIIARFIPVIRTFAPIVAGIGSMHYDTFLSYNVVGGLIWAVGLTLGGYYLGQAIPNIDHYLLPLIGVIVVVSIAPPIYHILKEKQNRTGIRGLIRKHLRI